MEKHKKEVLSRALRDLGDVDAGGVGGETDTGNESSTPTAIAAAAVAAVVADQSGDSTPHRKPRRKKRLSNYSPHKRKKQK